MGVGQLRVLCFQAQKLQPPDTKALSTVQMERGTDSELFKAPKIDSKLF